MTGFEDRRVSSQLVFSTQNQILIINFLDIYLIENNDKKTSLTIFSRPCKFCLAQRRYLSYKT